MGLVSALCPTRVLRRVVSGGEDELSCGDGSRLCSGLDDHVASPRENGGPISVVCHCVCFTAYASVCAGLVDWSAGALCSGP